MRSHDLKTSGNRIIDRLAAEELQVLGPHLVFVHLRRGDVIYEAGAKIEHVYFPTSCVISAFTIMLDGTMIEVASTGSEGITGHAAAIRDRTSVNRVVVSIPGGSLRMGVAAFHDVLSNRSSMLDIIARYNSAFTLQVTQSVACNGVHKLEMRCCRWLLMIRDRIGSCEIPVTHEFLSSIMGARRSSISDALSPLQSAGLLALDRGVIRLKDPAKIELLACECYQVVRHGYERLMSPE